ncbi:ATP-binding protein [Cytobacillus sp. Sa5YUA1]|uniref:ATP-binding protein n=1 Tax=Cytobacillus stercorigallinarum TaxID=2762240 RepID=A0ABR8QVT2_9BACI|nr:ATP-binding protein [Cytobacillus stercorigallinarum]MBD7939648.1 ATP-binding protein [Cytobacillus stercorigallinarum]
MRQLSDFPTKHIEGNLAFGRDGTVTAYFEVEGFGYDFRDVEQKKAPYFNQMVFLTKNQYDLHFLLIPFQTDVTSIIDKTIEEVSRRNFDLKEHGLVYLQSLKKTVVANSMNGDSNQYHAYIGVQLDVSKNKYKEGNVGTQLISSMKAFVEGLNSPVYKAVGLDPYDLLKSEIDAWKEQSQTIESEIGSSFSSPVRPLSAAETLFLIEYNFALTNEGLEFSERQTGSKVTGTDQEGHVYEAVRPNKKSFYDLQNAEIEEYDPKTLRLRKLVDNEIKEQFVQYLVIDNMDSVNYHPGFEWLYKLQTDLLFPVGVSIRAYHKSNKKIRKELSNALLEYQDQKDEARKAQSTVDKSVSSSEQGAIQMEEVFKKSGHPAYACSFVLRVTAPSMMDLKIRVEKVTNLLSRDGISLQTPYGDSMSYFMEFIPGSRRYSSDYWQEVSPGVLASLMFGATTNIGDNRGFLIGFTKKLKKPVFIQPDLAAKAFENVNNIFDSLSIMVAGETGKGKSVLMNLVATLSALTVGSQVLVIDPKGDRKSWVDGIPFIPKEFISVWTLGESETDAGCLDPFRTSADLREAKDICMDILSYLADVSLSDDGYSLLSEAIEHAGDQHDPCIGAALNYLKDLYQERPDYMSSERHSALERLISTLETLRKNQLATLLFGEIGQQYRVLDVNKPLQVLMVQNLKLPEKNTKIRATHKISEAILISITAFTKQYMFKHDRSKHKLILQDESKSIEKSEMGSELIDFIERKGRYYNTTLLKGTQKSSDYEDATNIGMKFCFQLYQAKEAENMLEFYNLPVTQNNRTTIQNFVRGEALFQDIYGRSAVIEVNTVFGELLKAFDSSTADEEERQWEKEREEKDFTTVGV